ncbi:MAG: MarR family winged helix-turn-helix transcriptional regulator [Ancrocorticia sp.]|uniref:MarR family winged helix-turn-helix transcriptional regulator n=1 Tax=Ancrocorticia sp. TaxID=2593684 RepID=UPI003F91A539
MRKIDELNAEHGIGLEHAVCFALYSATQAVVGYYRDVLSPFGVTYQQLLVLSQLTEEKSASPRELGDKLHMGSNAVTGLLNRMEKEGLIVRSRVSSDRRVVHVAATARARGVLDQLGFLPQCLAQAMELTPESAAGLLTELHSLRDAVGSAPRPSSQSNERADAAVSA